MTDFKKQNITPLLLLITAICCANLFPKTSYAATDANKRDSIIRKQLMLSTFPHRQVSKVDVRQINFHPLQQTGRHLHPIPVTGYIVSGTVLFQVEGEPAKILKAGDAFYEPANHVIVHFDNPSSSKPLEFIAFYLLDDHEPLIKMLPLPISKK